MGQTTQAQNSAMLTQKPDISLICPQYHEYIFFDIKQRLVILTTLNLPTGHWTQQHFTPQDNLSLAEIPESFSTDALLTEESHLDQFN